jgi:hypothetical protein
VGSTNTFTATGTVSDTAFARNYSTGSQLISAAFPVDFTPVGLGMVPGSGASDWTGGTSPSTGDYLLRVENGALVRYALRTDGSLRKVGSPSDFKATQLINSGQAVIVNRQKSATDVLESSPVSN